MSRSYIRINWKDAAYRINSAAADCAGQYIPELWNRLEKHISSRPDFKSSLLPLEPPANSDELALQMYRASIQFNVGPMAAVAGTFSERIALHCRTELEKAGNGSPEIIVENGGDSFFILNRELVLGIYAGKSTLSGNIALLVRPDDTPVAVCSSSGTMGHSFSMGRCDLATVFATDGALADCAATAAANIVKNEDDIADAVESIIAVEGIRAVLIIKNDKIGMAGRLPEIIRADPAQTKDNLTIHPLNREFP